MSAISGVDVRINNGPPVRGELKVEREVRSVESYLATKPDLRWELVDAAGHFHAYDLAGELPTLKARSVHKDCDGDHDEFECEGYDVTVYSCRICGEDVEPKRLPDPGPHAIAGPVWWSLKVSAEVPWGEAVSVRVNAGGAEFFGVATAALASVEGLGVVMTELIGDSPLGQRRRPPKCTCPLVDTSVIGGPPSFVRGDPAGCKVHGQKRDAEIEAAKRAARGDLPDPFYDLSSGDRR